MVTYSDVMNTMLHPGRPGPSTERAESDETKDGQHSYNLRKRKT